MNETFYPSIFFFRIKYAVTFVNFENDILLLFFKNVHMANMEEIVYKPAVENVMCPGHVTKRPVPAMVVVLKDGNYLCAIKVYSY